jgi:hypothetical protein
MGDAVVASEFNETVEGGTRYIKVGLDSTDYNIMFKILDLEGNMKYERQFKAPEENCY